MRRQLVQPVLAVILLLLVIGHIFFWYWPRPHIASPQIGGGVADTLALERFPVALWMPYPHQNLGYLARSAGLNRKSLEPLARISGLPTPAIPSFGSMPVPPASELAVVSDEGGQAWMVSAQVYPSFAGFARLSGRLANNPWLRGGELEVEGRRIEVRWVGDLWQVASPGFPQKVEEERAIADWPPSLGALQLRHGVHPLPAGRFFLRQAKAGWELSSETLFADVPWVGPGTSLDLPSLGAFLFVASGHREALDEPAQALVFLSQEDGQALELPRVVSIFEPEGDRWSLPGESILELSGREPDGQELSGWRVSAFDSISLEAGRELAPRLDPMFASGVNGRLLWGLWLDLDAGLTEVSRIAYMLGQVPIVPRRRLEQWRDIESVLRPMTQRLFRLRAEVVELPEGGGRKGFRLRLEPASERL